MSFSIGFKHDWVMPLFCIYSLWSSLCNWRDIYMCACLFSCITISKDMHKFIKNICSTQFSCKRSIFPLRHSPKPVSA